MHNVKMVLKYQHTLLGMGGTVMSPPYHVQSKTHKIKMKTRVRFGNGSDKFKVKMEDLTIDNHERDLQSKEPKAGFHPSSP